MNLGAAGYAGSAVAEGDAFPFFLPYLQLLRYFPFPALALGLIVPLHKGLKLLNAAKPWFVESS